MSLKTFLALKKVVQVFSWRFPFLRHTMWIHAGKLLKHSNFEIRLFRYVIWAPKLRNDKKKAKNGSLDRDFLKFLHRYDIYWVSRYPCCVLLALSWNTVGHYVNSILQCVLRFQRLLCCVDTHQTVKVQTQIRVNTNTNIIAEKWSYSRVFVTCYKYE